MIKARHKLSARSHDLDQAIRTLGMKLNADRWEGWAPHGHVTITEIVAPQGYVASLTIEGTVDLRKS